MSQPQDLVSAQTVHVPGVVSIRENGTHSSHNMLSDRREIPGTCWPPQLPLLCQCSKNLGTAAPGAKALLLFAAGPFLQATGKVDSVIPPAWCEGGGLHAYSPGDPPGTNQMESPHGKGLLAPPPEPIPGSLSVQ